MKTIEKIRQKIEELYDGEAPAHAQQCDFDDGYFTGIGAISKFIDSLESEKPMNPEDELEKELEKEINKAMKSDLCPEETSDYDFCCIARHFAQWGAKHLKK